LDGLRETALEGVGLWVDVDVRDGVSVHVDGGELDSLLFSL
jgi:hypothetical protein